MEDRPAELKYCQALINAAIESKKETETDYKPDTPEALNWERINLIMSWKQALKRRRRWAKEKNIPYDKDDSFRWLMDIIFANRHQIKEVFNLGV